MKERVNDCIKRRLHSNLAATGEHILKESARAVAILAANEEMLPYSIHAMRENPSACKRRLRQMIWSVNTNQEEEIVGACITCCKAWEARAK